MVRGPGEFKVKLWHIAKFLEEIPSKLPFAGQANKLAPAVQRFSRRDFVIYTTGLLGWFFLGVIAVSYNNLAAGLVYLVMGPSAYLFYLYLACTKCPYYGKTCYMGGGQCASRLYKFRQSDYTLIEDLAVPAIWISISAYPAIFLFFYKSWPMLFAYLTLALTWQIFHKRNICSKCLNVRCGLNPRFVGRTGRVQITR